MLSMIRKEGVKVQLYLPIKEYVISVSGTEAAAQLDPILKNFSETRDELLQPASHRNDSDALQRLIQNANMYISMWTTISGCIPFGQSDVRAGVNSLGKHCSAAYVARLLHARAHVPVSYTHLTLPTICSV
eukprot:TRINITY_DN2383_c0_g7_i2.p1 TRINITY_DN2383_c0_g7~~TRINITY_DN2383_c0_g7_i2.p1  ORF type:complete len:131 (-),score=9.82 TRINITY_DN2383_c0_g7_i2:47-439(-)